jgi:hypothetical protein
MGKTAVFLSSNIRSNLQIAWRYAQRLRGLIFFSIEQIDSRVAIFNFLELATLIDSQLSGEGVRGCTKTPAYLKSKGQISFSKNKMLDLAKKNVISMS